MDIFAATDFWKIAIPALGAILAWFVNERSRLAWEQYKRKEESYKELLRCLRGFYVATQDRELKSEFLHQVNLLWLYAPDDVIRMAYGFLETVKKGATPAQQNEKDAECGRLIEAIRMDLLARKIVRRTRLGGSDFRHFTAT
jgi:hypothetical protein